MNSTRRFWLFRGLVIAAIGLMLLSWFMPWWSADIEDLLINNAVVIHPWGLENNMGDYAYYLKGAEMPSFFAPLMWLYLGLAISALLVGAWIKDKNTRLFRREFNLSKLIIGVVGFSYIAAVVLAVVIAAIRTGELGDLHLLGRTFVSIETTYKESWIAARLLSGYWLACGVGPLLVILALLRNRIIGKDKLAYRYRDCQDK